MREKHHIGIIGKGSSPLKREFYINKNQ